MNKRVVTIASAGALAVVAVGAGLYITSAPAFEPVGMPAPERLGGPFTLTNEAGEPFGTDDLIGNGALVFFGFTYCPDVCPTELARGAQVVDQLVEADISVTPVFITIDPERDTPEQIGDYVSLFHEDMVGLTGTADEIASVADDYGVFYSRVEMEDSSDYLMDHTSFVYLLDPTGSLVWMFRPTDPVEAISETIRQAAG